MVIHIAGILDWPSVYMGGPSERGKKLANKIVEYLEEEGLLK